VTFVTFCSRFVCVDQLKNSGSEDGISDSAAAVGRSDDLENTVLNRRKRQNVTDRLDFDQEAAVDNQVSYGGRMILRICQAHVCGPHSLRLTFNDGTTKKVDVLPLLDGAIFEPLRDPAYFATMELDSICGTVVWPNGADFAQESLHELAAQPASESAA
jgi:hypothetical protein